MKLPKIGLMAAVAFALAPIAAHANGSDLFPDNQLTLDVFGTYTHAFETFGSQFDDNWRHGQFGGGLGVDYFFCKYIGIGVDSFADDKGQLLRDVSGSLYLRMPVDSTGFAPYIFGGPGGDFSPVSEWTEHAGAGVEFRFSTHFGIFADARYNFKDITSNDTEVRAGVQIAF